ncbi:hypothetical protein C8R44DRAFT_868462 [Mycena epipterygia]|nr:hypothetical protein C8R44DRAFT_868462 [Mycena epipterygia]
MAWGNSTRGRGGNTGTTSKHRAPPEDADYEDTTSASDTQKPQAKRVKVAVEPREPSELGERVNQVIHPGLLDALRHKRTHEEVEAKADHRCKVLEAIARKHAAAIATLAALNVEQDELAKAENQARIYSLDDVPFDTMDFTQEAFDHIENDEVYLSVSEYEKPKAKLTLAKKAKKPTRGKTQAEVEVETKALEAVKAKVEAGKKKSLLNSNAAILSRKAGLTQAWKKTARCSNVPGITSTPESPKLGGLTDEDTNAVHLDLTATTGAPRKNEMVTVVTSSDTKTTPSRLVVSKATVAKPFVCKPRSSVKSEPSKMPVLSLGGRQTPKLKTESSSISFTPDSVEDVNGLPAFIAPSWSSIFLVACHHTLYLSTNPMAIGAISDDIKKPGKETVAILQEVLNSMYLGNMWTLKWGDAICAKRWSAIGRAALQGADRQFEDARYPPNHEDRRQRHILSLKNGPAFHLKPTPESLCLLNPRDPRYINPQGYLESVIVIQMIAQYLKDDDFNIVIIQDEDGNDVMDASDLPTRAFGLAAAVVERAYKLHQTGVRAKPRDFSSANFALVVAGYIVSLKPFRASHWQSLLTACGAQVSARTAAVMTDPGVNSLDSHHENMYVPSSPTA